ncbi:MAG: sialidase family protein [Bryobacteraceae bacterium]
MITRREWISLAAGSACPGWAASKGMLYEGLAAGTGSGVDEAILTRLNDGRFWLLYGKDKTLHGMISTDRGRRWGIPQPVLEQGGLPIRTARNAVHLSLLHMKSGRLGMVYGGPVSRPGRDGTLHFRSSGDGGATWSPPVVIDPVFSLCRTSGARVLSNGRLAVPVFNWVSPSGGGDSEEADNSICISWIFYSDDEGSTWRRSLSELFVSLDKGRGGCYSFEEPSLEERADGSLLMYGRTELGVFFESVSRDMGIRWSTPKPTRVAASYTPPMLVRMPKSDDLLLVWNQASVEEIRASLSRHRLSTAISSDGGETWKHHRNLESMDDRAVIEPPARPGAVLRPEGGYRQPVDRSRYPHSPGCLRICYPTVVFDGDEVAITYDYGKGVGEFLNKQATKIKIFHKDWLYGS